MSEIASDCPIIHKIFVRKNENISRKMKSLKLNNLSHATRSENVNHVKIREVDFKFGAFFSSKDDSLVNSNRMSQSQLSKVLVFVLLQKYNFSLENRKYLVIR